MIRVRRLGCKKWVVYPTRHRSKAAAVRALSKHFMEYSYKRGEVFCTADWYEPTIMLEMVRR
jgi:hypothetical protein